MKKDKVREEILHQAQTLFMQYGYKKTTMDEIALASGKAKSTLYHHFESKNEVFLAVVEKEMISLRKHVKGKVEEYKTTVDKLSTYFNEFHIEVRNRINLYRLVWEDRVLELYGDNIFEKMMNYEKNYIARIIEDGVDSAELHGIEKNNIPWVAEIIMAAFLGIVGHLVGKEGSLDMEKLRSTTDIFIPRIFS